MSLASGIGGLMIVDGWWVDGKPRTTTTQGRLIAPMAITSTGPDRKDSAIANCSARSLWTDRYPRTFVHRDGYARETTNRFIPGRDEDFRSL